MLRASPGEQSTKVGIPSGRILRKMAEHETSALSLPESSARTIIALAESVWRNYVELWTLMKVWNLYRKIWMVNLVHFGQFQLLVHAATYPQSQACCKQLCTCF